MFRDVMASFKSNLPVVLVCLVLQIILAIVLSHTFLLLQNTLENRQTWEASKTQLEKGVLQAFSFFEEPQALARERLNLGTWQGFQEVLYKNALQVDRLEFDFWLDRDAYLHLIFNKNVDGFSSIRFSVNPHFESAYLESAPDGRFLHKEAFPVPGLKQRDWFHAELGFADDSFTLLLNGEEITRFAKPVLREQQIGFRGGLLDAHIDNIVIVQADGSRITESFRNTRNFYPVTLLFWLSIVMINVLLFVLIWLVFRVGKKRAGYYLVMCNTVVLACGVLFFGFQYLTGQYYPLLHEKLRQKEANWVVERSSKVTEGVRDRYSEIPADDVFRIMFVGSSQTWGAGASKQAQTFVDLLESKLNMHRTDNPAGTRELIFECVNTGISGANSTSLMALYNADWIGLQPDIVVINLSNNDKNKNPDWFAYNLEKMVALSVEAGIKPVLILEANSVENSEKSRESLTIMHDTMRQVGAFSGTPVIDMHAYLRRHYDTGFLWWDIVHLTDFGQELVAEKLYEELMRMIAQDRGRENSG